MLAAIASFIKIRITLSVGFIAATGWYVAERGFGDPVLFTIMLGTTLLVCAGVCSLNHIGEWRSDSLMKRTRKRPIPSGEIGFYPGLIFGILLTVSGLVLMGIYIGRGMVIGASLTGAIYLLIYTPLKKVTWVNTTVGAIPGALPIMGGWYAARGELGLEGWILLAVMFFWQHPHFYAIAWLCREDYERAGYRMLVKDDHTGKITFGHAWVHTLFLMVSSIGLVVTDFAAGWVYLLGIGILNIVFLTTVIRVYFSSMEEKNRAAQRVLSFSVWYQILYFTFIIIDNQFRVTIF